MTVPTNQRLARWLMLLTLAALWVVLWRHLSVHWNVNPQYSYGWLVPPLALYLAARRWWTRPAPDAPVRSARWVILAAAFLFAPAWLVVQPNPDWRLISWILALDLAALTAAACAAIGGRSWARHFAFPVAFTLTAVPWPSGLESSVTQGLMRLVAGATVEILNLARIPAVQLGNVIEIEPGLLGIDEACSGVRSLQATLMVSLFLGEMYRFGAGRRAVLLGAGLLVALLTNIARTFFLGWTAAHQGLEAIGRWHDPAGFTVLTACLVLVWILALVLSRKVPEPAETGNIQAPAVLPLRFCSGLAIWIALAFIGAELWFYRASATASQWTLTPPPNSQQLPLERAVIDMLKFDSGVASTWKNADGRRWVMFFFSWEPGPSRSRILARMHRPEICLPAAGVRAVENRGLIRFEVDGLVLPFEASQFETESGEPVWVYFCPWQNSAAGSKRSEEFAGSARMASLRAVLRRERNLGQQVAQFVLVGYPSGEAADAALRAALPDLVTRASQPTVPK